MDITTETMSQELIARVRHVLLELARTQEELALSEAARVPYWAPAPSSIGTHREAAQLLRQGADLLLAGTVAA